MKLCLFVYKTIVCKQTIVNKKGWLNICKQTWLFYSHLIGRELTEYIDLIKYSLLIGRQAKPCGLIETYRLDMTLNILQYSLPHSWKLTHCRSILIINNTLWFSQKRKETKFGVFLMVSSRCCAHLKNRWVQAVCICLLEYRLHPSYTEGWFIRSD